ncbi:hypothetical protein PVK06_007518 [Gossypium arboreum]|uniref:Reverse transcriptase n=1 Tax=Gossypium arboreum TaxID=29729 RepID=A0ABR0QHJ1_GOSAR|nr:hypothetical protein PVK06_007518 [Gossypium arboreum]
MVSSLKCGGLRRNHVMEKLGDCGKQPWTYSKSSQYNWRGFAKMGLRGSDDQLATTKEELDNIATEYFQGLFTTKEYNLEEIYMALKDMAPTKAPGVDSLPALFFQRYWHIVGPYVGQFCLDILNRGTSIESSNSAQIVRIPKIEHLNNLLHFKPISLCTVIYKLISKIVGNSFQKVLDVCIDESQSAFILGRLITDNVLVAYEILNAFKQWRMGKIGYTTLKLDMSKANNRVE